VAKINFIDVYKGRIKRIDEDIKIAINKKSWTELAKLRYEKSKLESYINNS
jgi:hypothetical protein